MPFRFKQRLQGLFITPNNSLIVGAITTSPGRFSSGKLEYYIVNQPMRLSVTIHKNRWKTASWLVRESYDITEGTGNIIASGKVRRETIDQDITVDYTPTKQVHTQFEVEVTSGSTTIRKYRVITVREIFLSDKEKLEVDNIKRLISTIKTDISNGIRTQQHIQDLGSTVSILDSKTRIAESEGKDATGFIELQRAIITLKADLETVIKERNNIQRN